MLHSAVVHAAIPSHHPVQEAIVGRHPFVEYFDSHTLFRLLLN